MVRKEDEKNAKRKRGRTKGGKKYLVEKAERDVVGEKDEVGEVAGKSRWRKGRLNIEYSKR
jgi:hypothetical protein